VLLSGPLATFGRVHSFRRHLSYANVVATLALFLALGGTAAATRVLITKPKQIKNGVITGKKLKRGTIQLDRLSSKTRQRLAGTAGPKGDAGAPGAPGLVRAYGRVAGGALDTTRSHAGILSARTSGSYTCVKLDPSIDASTASPVVALDLNGGATTFSVPLTLGWVQMLTGSSCDQPNEVRVATGGLSFNSSGNATVNYVGPGTSFFILVP
jgi:hypothetical protein